MFVQASDGVIYKNPIMRDQNKHLHYRDDLTMMVYIKEKGNNSSSKSLGGWAHYFKIIDNVKIDEITWENVKTGSFDVVKGNSYEVEPIAPLPLKLIVSNQGKMPVLSREVKAWFWDFGILEVMRISEGKCNHELESLLFEWLQKRHKDWKLDNKKIRVLIKNGKVTIRKVDG